MLSAQLITIGTEITSGEVVNTNASWLSLRLEEKGIRVFSHLSVRDQRGEIMGALAYATHPLVFVTGGLGPTSDDITRDCMADFTGCPLEFDERVWSDLKALYERRGLPLREAHRLQCHFPLGAERLANPVGTALGFYQEFKGRQYFVLPGPPRELEGMWFDQVERRLSRSTDGEWVRWTCLGAPESEVAEKVEPAIAGRGIEVGYRAQVPYVKVKIFVTPSQKDAVDAVENALKPWIVARGFEDLAEELLLAWPKPELRVADPVSGANLADRLFAAHAALIKRKAKIPELKFANHGAGALELASEGEDLIVKTPWGTERKSLPYKLPLNSERGKRSAAEWAIWTALCALNARERQN
jgi:molybdenum cofactor synthesis domain-containing protein